MAQVTVKGVFMGAHLKETVRDGNKKVSIMVDVYQPTSPDNDKTISVKCEDVAMLNEFNNGYSFGSVIELVCSVSAYRDTAYYKFLQIADEARSA